MRCVLLSACLATFAILDFHPSWAQVTPDGTLNTTINTVGNDATITNGTAAGGNLFHSFGQFSIPTGGSATFDLVNTPNVFTIFSRVTGGSVSNINGLIQTTNGINPVSLFLINPAGILFGPNASLNIGGSFVSTTANSIKFANGAEFVSTATPLPTPLLTVSVPIGLQMGTNPGAIRVNNTGHQLTGNFGARLTDRSPSLVGLQVAPGQSLVLVGGDLVLDGGILTAPGGQVELSAIGAQPNPTQVGLQNSNGRWQVTPNGVQPIGNLQFLNKALVNTSGTGQGAVQLLGGQLTMQNGSVVWLENRGSQASGAIGLNITREIDLIGAAPNTLLSSGIYADARSTGRASDIRINTRQLTLQEGGNIQSRSFAAGNTGRVMVNADRINFFDSRADNIVGVIGSRTSGSGNAADVTITTQVLQVNGGGSISSTSVLGVGNSGNILINASQEVALSVFASNVNDAIIGASAISATANAGDITINTARLSLAGGALISSSVYGSGKGGEITINATESVTLSGSRFSLDRLTLEGSTIRTAGVLLPIRAALNLPDRVTGPAGDVIINTPQLKVTDRGEIAVRHDSVGVGGTLEIQADTVVLDRDGRLTASTASGTGGDISIQSNLLSLRSGSTITTNARGAGGGGNINISSAIILGLENSDIIANAEKGRGGNIQITTQGIFGLKFRPQLTPDNDITASSQFGVNGNVEINTLGVDPSAGLVNLPVNLVDPSRQIATGCGGNRDSSFVATGRGGIPQNPTQEARHDRTWADTRDLSAFRTSRSAVSSSRSITPPPIVEASTLQQTNGQLELVAVNSSRLPMSAATCTGASVPAP